MHKKKTTHLLKRAARADIPNALAILKRAGKGRAPMKGDELLQEKKLKRR